MSGNFSLATRGTDSKGSNQNFLVVATDVVLGAKAINETRFQWQRNNNDQSGISGTPAISVLRFVHGRQGANISLAYSHSNNYEFQNYATSYTHGAHFFKFGLRVRQNTQDSYSTGNYNGTFTFTSLNAYAITQQGVANGLTLDQIRRAGAERPSQYSVAGGIPAYRSQPDRRVAFHSGRLAQRVAERDAEPGASLRNPEQHFG